MNTISSLQPIIPVEPLSSSVGTGTGAGPSFTAALSRAIQNVESTNEEADAMTRQFLAGEPVDLHNVAIATQRAALDFETLLQTRNKIVQAYQEVMRLQL